MNTLPKGSPGHHKVPGLLRFPGVHRPTDRAYDTGNVITRRRWGSGTMTTMNFADHLRSWSPAELAFLLHRRPDLLPATDRGMEAVARKAGTAMSLGRLLVTADVGMLVVAEALVALETATVDEIDHLLGTDDPMAVLEAVDRLKCNGVATVESGLISPVGSLQDLLHRPLGLGPSFVELADHLPSETIDTLAQLTTATGSTNRSATVRAVAHRLARPDVLASLMAHAPEPSRELLATLVEHRSPAIGLPTGYPYRALDPDDPLAWLIETGLVVAVSDAGAELPRELVVAATPQGLAPGAALREVTLQSVAGIAPDIVAGAAADSANRVLDGVEMLLRLAGQGEVSIRKSGGVGPRELKRLAKATGGAPLDIARSFELLNVARLLNLSGGGIAPSELAAQWWSMSRHRRYLALVRAWYCSERFLSAGLADAEPDRLVALDDAEPLAAVGAARVVTLQVVNDLGTDQAFQPDQLAEAVVWKGPNLWGPGEPPPEQLVEWMVEEAEFLGLITNNTISNIGRALTTGDEPALEQAASSAVAEDQDQFVLQSDLTAVSFGPLSPTVSRSLADMTERAGGAGDGLAPTFRFTETGLRRAFDRGWTTESITTFLTQHALAGVPQPLAYLIDDVARRYGSIRVMPAQSVIVTADEVLAVEVAANRRAAGLGLKLIAPTVLTSPLDPVTVVESLRKIGLFPRLEGSTVELDRPSGPGGAAADERPGIDSPAVNLPADWTGPPIPTGPLADEVTDAVAQLLTSDGHSTDGHSTDGHSTDGLVLDDLAPPEGADADTSTGGRESTSGPASEASLERQVTTADLLQVFWRRQASIEAVVDGGPRTFTGVVVGLGQTVSLLTADGVIEVPTDAVVTVVDPTGG